MSSYTAKGVADTNMDGIQRFTATGQPYKPKDQNDNSGMMFADTFAAGSAAANTLPFKFTDDSKLTIPVLPNGRTEIVRDDTSSMTNDVKEEKSRGFFRKLSTSTSSSKSNKKKNSDFVMKDMTRREYLKHYAKDDKGRYCGSEDPADDCILGDEDIRKYQKPIGFVNDMKKM